LVEAEALRGVMHLRQDRMLIDDAPTTVALRLSNGTMLDGSRNYTPAKPYHQVCKHKG
jgi:hypothetical protein